MEQSLELLPCPFCGGPVKLEKANAVGRRVWWGVVCQNTTNLGGTCCMEQMPSASKEAAVFRWNMRNGVRMDRAKLTTNIKFIDADGAGG